MGVGYRSESYHFDVFFDLGIGLQNFLQHVEITLIVLCDSIPVYFGRSFERVLGYID